jgi:YHS domain-containing protein
MLRQLVMAAALTFATATFAQAGPQYVDETGFANSGYDPVAYFEIQQAEPSTKQPEAVPGKADITADYNGAKWAFASTENRDKFVADPAKYAPQFDGHCAYGIAQGGKVPGNPNLWRIVDGKLYLNITPTVVGFWESDIPGNLTKAGENWTSAEQKPASDKSWKAIDDNKGTFMTAAPIK